MVLMVSHSQNFCDKDFTAIKRMRGSGINVIFLSGDQRVNELMARNRNIPFYSAREKTRLALFLTLKINMG